MYAVIVAAGNSARFNSDRPKQYISICGQTPIVESVKAFHGIDKISCVVCVI